MIHDPNLPIQSRQEDIQKKKVLNVGSSGSTARTIEIQLISFEWIRIQNRIHILGYLAAVLINPCQLDALVIQLRLVHPELLHTSFLYNMQDRTSDCPR